MFKSNPRKVSLKILFCFYQGIIVGVVNKFTPDLNETRKICFLHKLSRAFEHSMLMG
jgi:hypothetical protein